MHKISITQEEDGESIRIKVSVSNLHPHAAPGVYGTSIRKSSFKLANEESLALTIPDPIQRRIARDAARYIMGRWQISLVNRATSRGEPSPISGLWWYWSGAQTTQNPTFANKYSPGKWQDLPKLSKSASEILKKYQSLEIQPITVQAEEHLDEEAYKEKIVWEDEDDVPSNL